MKVGIIGGGSWGSALAIAFTKIAQVVLYCRNQQQAININTTKLNAGYLPDGVAFNSNVYATNKLAEVIDVDLLVIATPINAMRGILTDIASYNDIPDTIWVCKGFEANTGLLPHQIIDELWQQRQTCIPFKYGALLGPSFAYDVCLSKITGLTLVSCDIDFAIDWTNKLNKISNFRVYANSDLIGAEICGAIKNIIAIAAGIVDGLSLGDNARSALVTRSLSEISKLVIASGGSQKTVYGLSGVGDLILTCTGNLSRNRNVGLQLAQNGILSQILKDLGHVAEGVLTTKSVYELSKKLNIDMPITHAVYNVLYNNSNLKATIDGLLLREPKIES